MSFWSTLEGIATSAAGSLATAGVNSLFAGQSVRNSKKLMRYQNELNNQNYDKQRKNDLADYERNRKDYINDLLNADLRSTRSRRNAGLSVAFSNGYSPAQPLGQDIKGSDISAPSASAPMASAPQMFTAQDMLVGGQLALLKSQKENVDADTNNKNADTKKKGSETEMLNLEIKKFQETFQTQVDQMAATLANTVSQTDKNTKEIERLSTEIENMKTQGKLLTFDLENIKPQELKNLRKTFDQMVATIGKMNSETDLNVVEKSIKQIERNFKEIGIGIDSSFFGSLLAVLSSGKGDKVFERVTTTLKGFFTNIIEPIKSVFDVFDTAEPIESSPLEKYASPSYGFMPASARMLLERKYAESRKKH